jgi:hypothetical protein
MNNLSLSNLPLREIYKPLTKPKKTNLNAPSRPNSGAF